MKVKLLLSSLLLSGVVGVYGSGAEMPGNNEADAEQNDGSVPSLGKEVNAAVSTEVVCTNRHLLVHPHPKVRALGDLVASVEYADDSHLEIVHINISQELQRHDTYKLWDALNVIINKPSEVGFGCRLEPGFLQIQRINLLAEHMTTPEKPAPNGFVVNYEPLFQILRLASVNTLGVTVQSNAVLDQLIQILSTHGSLKALAIRNMSSQDLLNRLGLVFERHCSLEIVRLGSIPEVSIAEQNRLSNTVGYMSRKMSFYAPYVEWLKTLQHLAELDLSEVSVADDVRKQIVSLTDTLPNLQKVRDCPKFCGNSKKGIKFYPQI